ncbi:MAG: fasciclin domain-containing protein [Pseudomonadota bacterium]
MEHRKLISIITICSVFALSTTALMARDDSVAESSTNIVETASGAGQFEVLLAAATSAGLVPALSGEGPLTVFAPTDDAFGTLRVGTIDSLLEEENRDLLTRILSYHVVSGQVGSQTLADGVSLKTLAGPRITFEQTEKGFSVEGARILTTDIAASNGLIHVIDRVIMPPEQISRVDARRMIMSSITRGAPMYNHGNAKGTTQVYSMTIKSLIASANLKQSEIDRLQKGLDDSLNSENYQQSAWDLRYAMDAVLLSLAESSRMNM